MNLMKTEVMIRYLNKEELINITGGAPLWKKWVKQVEDAGQYVAGFLDGLFTGDCPSEC